MQIEPEIAYRNVDPTPSIERAILRGLEHLERAHPRITGCRVMVEIPHPRHERGNLYRVRIDVTVPGREVVVSRPPPPKRSREDPNTAILEAFRLVVNQLREERRKEGGRPRAPEAPLRGRVVSMEKEDGYGFLLSSDGSEIYFHRTGVPDDRFDEIDVGMQVRFVEEEVDGALRAVSVMPLHRRPLLPEGEGAEEGGRSPEQLP